MADKTATFTLNLESNARALSSEAAAQVEALRSKIEQAQGSLKGMQGALRSLKGSSDEVASAKTQLKAKIEAEKGAISQANLALLKHGQLFQKVKQEVDRTKSAEDKLREGIKAAGGPVKDLTERFDQLKGLLEGTHGKAALLALGFGTLVVGVAALTAGLVDAGFKLGKFVIGGANALRSMNLLREAATGSAENAKNLGTQVDLLSRKVATSKEKINETAVAIAKSLSGGISKASGQAIVDTFAAVTQASAAMGDEVGNTLKGLIDRGKAFNRVWMNPQELQGTGLQFKDIAGALSKNLHVGIDQAKAALFEGRVSLEAGAAALRTAVEAKFGKVNAEKLLDLDVQLDKTKEHLIGLTKNIALEPLLKGVDALLSKFDETTVTGKSIQVIFTKIGDAIVKFSVGHIDDMVKGVETFVLTGLKAVAMVDRWTDRAKGLTDAFLSNQAAMEAAKVIGLGLVAGIGAVGAAFAAVAAGVAGTAALIGAPFYALYKGYQFVKGLKWSDLGDAIVDGLTLGIFRRANDAVAAVKALASRIKSAFVGKDGIDAHSPSRFFEKGGRDSARGYAEGLAKGAPRAQEAAQAMGRGSGPAAGAGPAGALAARGGGGAGPISVTVIFNLPPGMGNEKAQEIAKHATRRSVLDELTRAVRQGLVSQGIPTQVPVT